MRIEEKIERYLNESTTYQTSYARDDKGRPVTDGPKKMKDAIAVAKKLGFTTSAPQRTGDGRLTSVVTDKDNTIVMTWMPWKAGDWSETKGGGDFIWTISVIDSNQKNWWVKDSKALTTRLKSFKK